MNSLSGTDPSSLLEASPQHGGVKFAGLRKGRAGLTLIWAAVHFHVME